MAAETWDGTPATIDGAGIVWFAGSVQGVPLRHFSGAAWIARRTKYWNGTSWEWVPVHYWNGRDWGGSDFDGGFDSGFS